MGRPFVAEGKRKSAALQIRATKEDIDCIQTSIQNIRTTLMALKQLDGGGQYPAPLMADIIKAAVAEYDEKLTKDLVEKIDEIK